MVFMGKASLQKKKKITQIKPQEYPPVKEGTDLKLWIEAE